MSKKHIDHCLVLGLLLIAGSGCTHVVKQRLSTVRGYPFAEKHPLKVELLLSEELRKAEWQHKSMGDTFKMPPAENLTHKAEVVAHGVFSEVMVSTVSNAPARGVADAVLVPKSVSAEQSMGVMKVSPSKFTVSLEWSLKDAKGDPVWIQTVQGEGQGEMGNAFTGTKRQRERTKMMLEDLFLQILSGDGVFTRDQGSRERPTQAVTCAANPYTS